LEVSIIKSWERSLLFVEKGAAVQLFSLPNQAPAAARRLIEAQQRVHYANKLDIASFQVKWVNGVLGAQHIHSGYASAWKTRRTLAPAKMLANVRA
jgi:hypothetical protein